MLVAPAGSAGFGAGGGGGGGLAAAAAAAAADPDGSKHASEIASATLSALSTAAPTTKPPDMRYPAVSVRMQLSLLALMDDLAKLQAAFVTTPPAPPSA